MEMNPQRVRSAEFKTVRKGGLDAEEVRAFLGDVATELERAQNQATAMEARARAAVARLQEMGETPTKPAVAEVEATTDEAETISRTLLLAQRTADTTVAEANAEADRIRRAANDEAATTRDSTREMAAQLLDEARQKARQAGEAERVTVSGEVDALKARRDFLEADVEHLELFLVDQRNRVRDAATALLDVTERVPGGLGDVRRPLLSASDDDVDSAGSEAAAEPTFADDGGDQLLIQTDIADEPVDPATDLTTDGGGGTGGDDTSGDDAVVVDVGEDETSESGGDVDTDRLGDSFEDDSPWGDRRDDPTQAMSVVESSRTSDDSDGFRFSFDDERRS